MDEITGQIDGPVTLGRDTALSGEISGSVVVTAGVSLELYGRVVGDLVVEPGGAAVVHGVVTGAVLNQGAYVRVLGSVGQISDTGGQPTVVAPHAVVGP
jgi:cytoskeletal protein CcmA (bactofilin family)